MRSRSVTTQAPNEKGERAFDKRTPLETVGLSWAASKLVP